MITYHITLFYDLSKVINYLKNFVSLLCYITAGVKIIRCSDRFCKYVSTYSQSKKNFTCRKLQINFSLDEWANSLFFLPFLGDLQLLKSGVGLNKKYETQWKWSRTCMNLTWAKRIAPLLKGKIYLHLSDGKLFFSTVYIVQANVGYLICYLERVGLRWS